MNGAIRYTGKMDGLHIDPKRRENQLIVNENKTGARLDDSWFAQWQLSHSITGYCVAATVFAQELCERARILGMRIPIGKLSHEGIRTDVVYRPPHTMENWLRWIDWTVSVDQQFYNNPLQAPMYTHSCNRYFRPCSFVPLCSSDLEDKSTMFEQLVIDEWSPLDE